MNDAFLKLAENIGGTLVLAIFGAVFRHVRKYFRALRYAQEDISTIWTHLDLPRRLRSGSYAFPRRGEEEEE